MIGMKLAGIKSESIFTNEVLFNDSPNEESFDGTDLSAKASSPIEGEVTP
jgi:hypothetical protein